MEHLVEKYSKKMKMLHVAAEVKRTSGKAGEAIVTAATQEKAAHTVVGTAVAWAK